MNKHKNRIILTYGFMFILLLLVGFLQSWNVSLAILNLCIISAIMSLGINIQWGNSGIVNFGAMGFAALGGLCCVLVSMPITNSVWQLGGFKVLLAIVIFFIFIFITNRIWKFFKHSPKKRIFYSVSIFLIGFMIMRLIADPAIQSIESFESAKTGYLGGVNLPIIFSWPIAGLFAAFVAFLIGKIALGLRSDYLAIATLGISEIVLYFIKNEDWLTRGVKNVNGLPRPVPYEIDLQNTDWLIKLTENYDLSIIVVSSIIVKLAYSSLFLLTLIIIFIFFETVSKSPWGRMMRAIRDNEISANAMGKDVKKRHLQVFVIGSAIIGIAGAMMTTLDGQFTPASYQPIRYTFLIWIMVIVGGSGNNYGAVLGGFLIWFFWVESEPLGLWIIEFCTSLLDDDSLLKNHLLESAAHMRLIMMGLTLLLALRFAPKGIIEEQKRI
jgi:branched-chain amino acid transport system permease protein|tara:strand:+ start:1454 stop:2773 length:1320 start_codon:yes stop_codon:yes gene_type:complete